MLRHAWAALAASVVLAGCAGSAVSFPNANPGKPLTISASEARPEGPGPFPPLC